MSHFSKIVAGAVALAVVAPLTVSSALAQDARLSPKLAIMSVEQFHDQAQIIDDHLEAETVISTEQAFRNTRGIFKTAWNDNHLRAVIDKRTGQARFEVRQIINYPGSFRGYGEASYQTAAWPVSTALTKVRDNAVHCALFESGESCFEEVTFAVDEAHLRQIAQRYDAAAPGQWTFKFKAGDAYEHRAAIVQAEVVGLLRAVDDYKRGLPHLDARADQPASAG